MRHFLVEESEKNIILEMHNSLLEQSNNTPIANDDILNKAISLGCLKDGKLQRQKSTGKIWYIKGSVTQKGKMIKFFPDMTYEFEDGSKKGKWGCSGLEKTTEPTPQQKKDQDLKKYLDEWVAYYSGQPLYKGAQIKHQLDVTPVEKATWKEVSIPNSAKETGSEKFVYISSEKKKEENNGDPKKDENPSLKDVRTASDISKDDCEKVIEQWYQNFATKPEDFDKAYFDKERPRAMYCKRRFYKKWGVDFNASRLNKIIEFMSRTRDNFEGRISPSLRSPWKLD